MKTALLSTLALLSIAGPSFAAPAASDVTPKVAIAYADLDLNQAQDAAVMLKRIRRAAAEACRQGAGHVGNDTDTILRVDACYRQSVARAVTGLAAPKVTQAYAGRPDGERLAQVR
jgi:UrcA family protein